MIQVGLALFFTAFPLALDQRGERRLHTERV